VASNGDYRAGALATQGHGAATRPAAADQRAQAGSARESGRALRLLGLAAAATGLAGLTAAACVLSYSSIHHLATNAGVSSRLATVYPLAFDAVLVVAGCAVLALRGAGLPSRIYAWLCLLVLLGALATGGTLHAAAVHIPRRQAAIAAAVIPWALVLIGFGLLLAMLRYARIRRLGHRRAQAGARAAAPEDEPTPSDAVVMASAEPPQGLPLPAGSAAGSGQPQASAAPAADAGPLGRAEPATNPLPKVPSAPEPAAGSVGWPGSGQQARPPVRQADMQLRARIPRQPADQAQPAGQPQPADEAQADGQPQAAGQVQPADQAQPADVHGPFMPPVGPAPTGEQTNPRAAEHQAAEGGPAVPGEPTTPASGADPAGEAGEPGALNAAPTNVGEPGEPPALRRPRSSPTPPGE
jgi:uncharacterized protein DUF2637